MLGFGNLSPTAQKTADGLVKAAPHWVALIVLVVVFLIYMDRTHDVAKQVADQRIKVCHDVQSQSTKVLDSLVARLEQFSTEYALLREAMRDNAEEIKRENSLLRELFKELMHEVRELQKQHEAHKSMHAPNK